MQLSALPGAEDLEQVRALVLDIAQTKRHARVGSTVVNLIEPQFFLDPTAASREDVLAQMPEALTSASVVDADFHRGVLEREAMASTSLGSGAAIPPSMIMGPCLIDRRAHPARAHPSIRRRVAIVPLWLRPVEARIRAAPWPTRYREQR